ncbi:MAG: cell wall hydrolase [Lachnospiraceae bacterium]|nr:cell wall hydrolase [Lachnospiraceae bacterium]
MRFKRLIILFLSLAVAFSSTNPHRASAATVEEALTRRAQEEKKQTELTVQAAALVGELAKEQQESMEEPDLREISSQNAILVQMALQEEARRVEEARQRRAETQSAAEQAAAKARADSRKLQLSRDDLKVLYQIVQAEAGDQSLKGRIMVVNVIMNRVRSSYYPDTVRGVVFQKSQFSPVASGSYYTVNPDATTKRAVQAAVNGEDYSQGALYFCTRSIAGRFSRYLTRVTSEGDHVFFK